MNVNNLVGSKIWIPKGSNSSLIRTWKKVLSISYIRGGVYKENKKYPWAEFGKAQVKLNLSRNDKDLLGTVQVSCEQIQPPSK